VLGEARTWGLGIMNTVELRIAAKQMRHGATLHSFAATAAGVFFVMNPTFGLRPSCGAKLLPHYREEGISSARTEMVTQGDCVD